MSNRESNPTVVAGYVFIFLLAMIAVAVFTLGYFLVKWTAPEPTTSCESIGAHVVWLDDDHTVCVRNGRVVTE